MKSNEKKRKRACFEQQEEEEEENTVDKKRARSTVIYCDGGCSNNGKSNARASIGVWFRDGDERNQSSLLPKEKRQTNQVAEVWAAMTAIRSVPSDEEILIKTDSMHTINVASDWRHKWKAKSPQWNLPRIINIDLYREFSDLLDSRSGAVHWQHVKGHAGEKGNTEADRLATLALANRAREA